MDNLPRDIEDIIGARRSKESQVSDKTLESISSLEMFGWGAYFGFDGAMKQNYDDLSECLDIVSGKSIIDAPKRIDHVGKVVRMIPSDPGHYTGFSPSFMGYMAGNIAANPAVLGSAAIIFSYCFSR